MDKSIFIPRFSDLVKLMFQFTLKFINIDLSKTFEKLCKQLFEKFV